MKNKYKIALVVIALCLSITFLFGTSYALWQVNKVQEGENKLVSGCFEMEFQYENVISLNNDYPMSDANGMKKTPYRMTVKNTCNIAAKLNIVMNVFNDSTMEASHMKLAMSGEKTLSPTLVSTLTETTPVGNNASNAKIAYDLGSDHLEPQQTKIYEFKLWIDEQAGNDVMKLIFKADFVIEAAATKSLYADASGAEQPDLDNGMIPVTYDTATSKWVKADTSTKWYDYNTQWWANTVTVTSASRATYTSAAANTPIEMNDIETMWVWVPRYEYNSELLKDPNYGGTAENPGTQTQPKGIEINFISKDTVSASSSNFTIHDAFKWGDEEASKEQLSGIWVAKFEMSAANTTSNTLQVPIIKPNVTSWRNAQIGTMWTSIHQYMNGTSNQYGLTNTDTHLMKNMEWGAVAYLSQSKYGKYGNANYTGANKEIYQNKSSSYITGMSNGTPSSSTTNTQVEYHVEGTGTGASTTGNIYGIYDMSGGAEEYVMGIMKANGSNEPAVGYSTSYNSGWSGKLYNGNPYTGTYESLNETVPRRYYDLYDYGTSETDYTRGHKGDATKEVIASNSASTYTGWYSDDANFVNSIDPFFMRGGYYSRGTNAGVFYFNRRHGYANSSFGGRAVAVHQAS